MATLQDYTFLAHYITGHLVQDIGPTSSLNSSQKNDTLCIWAHGLGLRKPSEPTIQAMLTIKLHLSGVVAGESDAHDVSKYASDRHELFKNLKTHFRKISAVNGVMPSEWVSVLPCDPCEFEQMAPGLWSDFDHRDLVSFDDRWHLSLASLRASIPMRNTNALVSSGNRDRPGTEQDRAVRMLEGSLQSMQQSPQPARRSRRRLTEKSPRGRLYQASELLDRLCEKNQRAPVFVTPKKSVSGDLECPGAPSRALQKTHSDCDVTRKDKNEHEIVIDKNMDTNLADKVCEKQERYLDALESSGAQESVQELDAKFGIRLRPAAMVKPENEEFKPVSKSMPTPSKMSSSPKHEDKNFKMKKLCSSKPPTVSSCKKVPAANSVKKAAMKKPASHEVKSSKGKNTSLPRPPPHLLKKFSDGCSRCRYTPKCCPSCWKLRGFSVGV